MLKWLENKLTNNKESVPLFWIDFNYQLYKKHGKKGSCNIKIHPLISGDDYIKNTLNDLIDYIRNQYNVEKL